ncbi:MAG: hypothetical protein AAF800_09565 [Planctomycetota bacterium]
MATPRTTRVSRCLLALGFVVMTGCIGKEVAPGVTQSSRETRTVVAALPKAAAAAAEQVLINMELANVTRNATKVDALVTASTALGEVVEVKITTAGARTSAVVVTHAAGPGLAFEVVQAVEQRLSGAEPLPFSPLGPRPAAPAGGAGADNAAR